MKVKLPQFKNVVEVPDAPSKHYYKFGIGYFYVKRLEVILKLIGKQKFENVLEIGYGSGLFFKELKKRCKNLFGVDIHTKAHLIEKSLKKENVTAYLISGNVLNLPFKKNSFDCIVSLSTLEHIKEIDKAILEIYFVLKKNGVAILSVPVKNKITDAMLKILRVNINEKHPVTYKDILQAAQKIFFIEEVKSLPAKFPIDYSLFTFYVCRKK